MPFAASYGSMKVTPLPSEYMHRWVFSLLNRLQAILLFATVGSSVTAPDAVYSFRIARWMVTLRCASYSSAISAILYSSLFL